MIHIYRDFAATPAQLFRAHTDPALFARWVGPTDIGADIDYWDARDGGSWRYTAVAAARTSAPPSGAASTPWPRADRPDLHLGGHARGRGARDADLRGPRRRPHPPARDEPVRLASRRATAGWPAAWSPASTTATTPSSAMAEAGEL